MKIKNILLIAFCFYVNWLWVSFAADMDFNLYNYAELVIFSLIQYFFASIGLYCSIKAVKKIIKGEEITI